MKDKTMVRINSFELTNLGFTLIELLAVIVILAIISIIAVPIVLSIINDSKESSIVQSAEFYLDALQNAIIQENIKLGGTLNPKECIVDINGNVSCDGVNLEIELKGEKPEEGVIIFDNGKRTRVNLKYGDKKITLNNNGVLIVGDEWQICKLIKGEKNAIGSKYQCEVKKEIKYYFYVLSHENDGTTNLIMDRNICEDGTGASSSRSCLVSWNASGNSSSGPVTAMTYLTNATSTWENLDNLNIIYDDEAINKNFTGFVINGKARLPKYAEVYGTDKCLISYEGNENYGTCKSWLVDNLNVSEYYTHEIDGVNIINGIWGYWTLSSYSGFDYDSAWHVHYKGDIGAYQVNLDNHLGVRPVINVKL